MKPTRKLIISDDFLKEFSVIDHSALPPALHITAITMNSKAVTPGSIFVARRGTKHDGHQFLDQAFAQGAALAVVSDPQALKGRPGLLVENTDRAWSQLSAWWFENQNLNLKVIGVTGTNGKSTIHWLLGNALEQLNIKSMLIGTMGVYCEGKLVEGNQTTPDAYEIHESIAAARKADVKAIVMEVSSHSLDQKRVADIKFDIGIYTNLTRDHLDYHADMEEYFLAKRKLFEGLSRESANPGVAIINLDDPYGQRLIDFCKETGLKFISYGRSDESCIHIESYQTKPDRMELSLKVKGEPCEISCQMIGLHNAYNLAAVTGALIALGFGTREVASVLSKTAGVPGRLEIVGTEQIGVYVDYAHTPDGLDNVLQALRPICTGRLWVVFGCGGDRDRGKRPMMGEIAGRLADLVVVTSDNPRTEDPDQIIKDILTCGIQPQVVEPDRKAAILKTLSQVKSGDIILIAGKGHEAYQIIGTERRYFSDQEIVREYFRSHGN